MSKSQPYLQFPLCLLAFEKSAYERLNSILGLAVVDAGAKLWAKAPPGIQQAFISQISQRHKLPTDFDQRNTLHVKTLYGADALNVSYSRLDVLLESYGKVTQFVAKFQQRYGGDALVRIKTTWFFDARDHRGLTYREFAILCAIYSCLGNKPFAQITQPRIRRCAMGYRTGAILKAELRGRADAAQPFTVRQVRDTIDRLHQNRFFARCTFGRRRTFYSNRQDNEQLRKRVLARLSYPAGFRSLRTVQDESLTAAVKRARLNLSAA